MERSAMLENPDLVCKQLEMSYLAALENFPDESQLLARQFRLDHVSDLGELSPLLNPDGQEQKQALVQLFREENPNLQSSNPRDLAKLPGKRLLEAVFRALQDHH